MGSVHEMPVLQHARDLCVGTSAWFPVNMRAEPGRACPRAREASSPDCVRLLVTRDVRRGEAHMHYLRAANMHGVARDPCNDPLQSLNKRNGEMQGM